MLLNIHVFVIPWKNEWFSTRVKVLKFYSKINLIKDRVVYIALRFKKNNF